MNAQVKQLMKQYDKLYSGSAKKLQYIANDLAQSTKL
jgi:hypothetical protein